MSQMRLLGRFATRAEGKGCLHATSGLFARLLPLSLGFLLLCVYFLFWSPRQLQAQENTCAAEYQTVSVPLGDLGSQTYRRMDGQQTDFVGGLYPNGENERPPSHERAGLDAAVQIVPLDAQGTPDPRHGKIVMVSVGMSNTSYEFRAWMSRLRDDAAINPNLVFINGAQEGRTAERWADPGAPAWQEVDRRLAQGGVTAAQVQVAWVKQTHTRGGDFPEKAIALQGDLEAIARNLTIHYPNIKIAYFSSRTRSFTYWRGLSPEPNAFETGFAVKWMIEKQIQGDPGLNFDPAKGEVKAPYLSWGPYLWMDGSTSGADDPVWTADDLAPDCTHPSHSGTQKVADRLAAFFTSDSTTIGWFLAAPPPPTQPAVAHTAVAPRSTVSPQDRSGRSTPLAPAAASRASTPTARDQPARLSTPPKSTVTAVPATPPPSSAPQPRFLVFGLYIVVASAGAGWILTRRQ